MQRSKNIQIPNFGGQPQKNNRWFRLPKFHDDPSSAFWRFQMTKFHVNSFAQIPWFTHVTLTAYINELKNARNYDKLANLLS